MKNKFMRGWVSAAVTCMVALLFLTGCGGGGGGGGGSPETTDITISLDFSGGSSAQLRFSQPAGWGMAPLAATVNDVASVTVDVFDGATPLVTGAPLSKDPVTGVWSGTLSGLPVGVALTFTAHAFDGTIPPVEIFTGTTNITLTGSGDSITIAMAPPTPPPPLGLPRIVAIQIPASITAGLSASITFDLEGNANEVLDWSVTAGAGGGSFVPPAGQITMSAGGTGSQVVTYTAPGTPGTYTHTILVTNPDGNSVQATFDTVVAGATGNVVLQFAPVVANILGSRQGSTVTWTASVVDDGPALSYAWSAAVTGGVTPGFRVPADTNPAFLDGYDETVDGTVSVQVTDGDGLSTTATINLPAGQFPDNLVVIQGAALPFTESDGVPEMTGVPTLTPDPINPGDTATVTVPVDNDVGYLVACVVAQFADGADLATLIERGCTSNWTRTPATGTATNTLPVEGFLPASNEYWVLVFTCLNLTDCDNSTGIIYGSFGGGGTYSKQSYTLGALNSSVDTGVAIPTYTSPGGALGFQWINGDGVLEMTGAPTVTPNPFFEGFTPTVVVTVPVDADAEMVCVDMGLGFNTGSGWISQVPSEFTSGCATVAVPGTEQTVDVTLDVSSLVAADYSLTVAVVFNPPGPDNTNTSYNYASSKNPGYFRVAKYPGSPNSVETETGVLIPIITGAPIVP